MMELFIETLTGTAFELRVSPFDTIISVKSKIQKLEGIPISQQHLIWQTVELDDDCCLHEYDIHNGATLKLVLAMRGGPINTRRVPLEDSALMAECMEPDEMGEKLPATFLVFKNGDQFNVFRVVEKGDGTLTPMSEPFSPAPICNLCDDDEEVESPNIEKFEENVKIKEKISLLKNKMDDLSINKKARKLIPNPPAEARSATSTHLKSLKSNTLDKKPSSGLNRASCLPPVLSKTIDTKLDSDKNEVFIPRPPTEGKLSGCDISQHLHRLSRKKDKETLNVSAQGLPRSREFDDRNRDSTVQSTTAVEMTNPRPSSKRKESLSLEKLKDSLRPPTTALLPVESGVQRKSSLRQQQDVKLETLKPFSHGIKLESLSSKEARVMSGLIQQASFERVGTSSISNFSPVKPRRSTAYSIRLTADDIVEIPDAMPMSARLREESISSAKLPPVNSKKKSNRAKRCFFCAKKTGLATSYMCRCGNNFCAQHRLAETHDCTFDYKTEGRKLLEQSNPVVSAPKLPKI